MWCVHQILNIIKRIQAEWFCHIYKTAKISKHSNITQIKLLQKYTAQNLETCFKTILPYFFIAVQLNKAAKHFILYQTTLFNISSDSDSVYSLYMYKNPHHFYIGKINGIELILLGQTVKLKTPFPNTNANFKAIGVKINAKLTPIK